MDTGHKSPPSDEAESKTGASPSEGRKVLVVDDYDDAREMYAEYLEFLGYEVQTARNGQEAVERARESHPDVILMDLSLPVLSGWDATQLLKTDETTRDIPVMALTGHVFASSSDKAREVGCDAFVTKPALPDTVADQIQALLRKTGSKPPSR
ncbi:response regulator [Melittangium boletus]|uniref:Chemotaxis protein CheY n=1 Tax=Melittangium boletus DSM 14713 TaxID=1294270 RepID=A0A250IL36_9BACT|nr:response regulator [Melittangium boletus]ATB31933.1 chemotaxis protein CheY [Melittangium boletus DSM 14713]